MLMKVFVTAKPNAYEARIEKIDDTHFVIAVEEPPVKGQANYAIIRALAKYFSVPPLRVRILSGFTSRNKIVDVQL